MVDIFHGDNEETHDAFQRWRQRNPDGFHMTEKSGGEFVIHYAQDARENAEGRGCMHQGVSTMGYLEDKNSCYTKARKVCSNDLDELLNWADNEGVRTRNCSHCETGTFPFPRARR